MSDDFSEIVNGAASARVGQQLTTRFPDAKRIRRRVGGVLLDVIQIRPRDLVVGDRIVVRCTSCADTFLEHVGALCDVGRSDHVGGRYRYEVSDGVWRALHPQSWVEIVVDG